MNHSPTKNHAYRPRFSAPCPLSNRFGPPGDVSITTFNLYNLFEVVQTASGPSSSQALSTKIAKLVLALRYELLLPHILDHILVSPALMTHFTAVDVLHFNTAHPEIYQSDPNTACRASDHDPLETRFTFNAGAS